jgi:hypothetical protein
MSKQTFKKSSRTIDRPEPTKERTIGFGVPFDASRMKAAGLGNKEGLGSFADQIQANINCPIWVMPVIEQVRWTLGGPQSDISITKNFGAKIDLFGSGEDAQDIDFVETTMAQPGQLQTHTLACAIGFHIEPEPLCWTADGNAFTTPETGVAAPISPDVFTQNDLFNGALGTPFAGATPTQAMVAAYLEWGWWANIAAWSMVRGYNLRWKIGQHTNIMDEVLRHTAYMPPNAQEGSASSSEVDIINFVRRANNRYEQLGSGLDFLPVNRIRIGSVGAGGANHGVFRPTRDHERVGATYGGMDLRSMLRGNSEFRKLASPYMIKAGIPIGLFAQECDGVQADIMRQYLSITQGYGGHIPPQITPAGNISGVLPDGSGITPVGLELTLDGNLTQVPQQINMSRAIFKGGELKIGLLVKGFEVTDEWYTTLQNNADVRDIVMNECGCCWAKQAG